MDPRIVTAKLNALQRRAVVQTWPTGGWQARTARHLAPASYAYDGDWQPLDGDGWWPAGATVFLRADVPTPPGAPLADLWLTFDATGLEGLLTLEGRPYAGLDANHLSVPVPHAGMLHLEAECIAVLRAMSQPELADEYARLKQVRFEQVDAAIKAAWYDFAFAWDAANATQDETRRRKLLAALEAALLAVDLTLPPDRFRREVLAAQALFRDHLSRIAPDPEGGRIFLTGHSHIDTAWLWPLRETIRKCGRTFSTMCRLLERYPSFHFTCSQPQQYAYTKRYFPSLYQEIKRWVKAGRWEAAGGMWVEPDCNTPSGEALIRQFLYGLRFFRDEFGARPRTCWLPDVFGYPASLPGILHGCGIPYFYTYKLHWQSRNGFPHHLFHWEGIDGSRVLAHIPLLQRAYNGLVTPEEMVKAWDVFAQKGVYDELLQPFGYGDGGGGPTEKMVEYAARARAYPGLPACRVGNEEVYFDDVVKAAPDLPSWRGELYLETHRGTFTTQAHTKRANRQNELLLREAEIAATLAGWQGDGVDMTPLAQAWETLLLLQFHDILPGSSIGEVYAEAAQDHAAIEQAARAVRDAAVQAIARRAPAADLLLFNSLSWERHDVVTATLPAPSGPLAWATPDGQSGPVQVVAERDGQAQVVFTSPLVPPVGYATVSLRAAESPAASTMTVTPSRLENRFFLIELNGDGEIVRLWDKRHRREVIPAGARANRLQLFQDGPEREAAWNVHNTFARREYPFEGDTRVEVAEAGPVRGTLRVTRAHRASRFVQDIVIYDALPRIDFITQADWRERQVMLKVAFPVEVLAEQATYEIQFGAVQRATHNNTSWEQEKFEVPAHRWADLSEAGYGVSLLNDSKYGYDVKGHVLRLTLLRGAEWPDPHADEGQHIFTYSLWPHGGDWRDGDTVRAGWALNVPLVAVSAHDGDGTRPARHGFITLEGPCLLETLKPAEDGNGVIVRTYEPHGGRGPAAITVEGGLASAGACNLVEEGDEPVAVSEGRIVYATRPFQIHTFRLRRG